MLAKLCSKSFKVGFSSMWTENFQMYNLGFKEVEEPEIKLPTFVGSWRKQGNSRKASTFASLTTLKPLTVWITANCGKFLKSWEYQTMLPIPWETCLQVKKQQLEPYMEQLTVSKSGKEYIKAVIVTLFIKLICRVHHVKCWAGWSTHWNQDCWEKYQ